MDAWVWWLVAALLLLAVEAFVDAALFLAMLAGGALAAAVAAGVGGGVGWQVGAFAVVSVLLLVAVRPVARKHLRTPTVLRSGVAALVGRDAVVLEAVDAHDGRIKLAGETWSARAYDETAELPVGARVFVIEIDGATALVAGR